MWQSCNCLRNILHAQRGRGLQRLHVHLHAAVQLLVPCSLDTPWILSYCQGISQKQRGGQSRRIMVQSKDSEETIQNCPPRSVQSTVTSVTSGSGFGSLASMQQRSKLKSPPQQPGFPWSDRYLPTTPMNHQKTATHQTKHQTTSPKRGPN